MHCPDCTQTLIIPACTDNLVLGIIDDVSQNIYIFANNVTTQRQQRQDAVSNADGVVTMDLSDPSEDFYSENHQFEVWVTLRDTNSTERIPIEVGENTYECFTLNFEKFFENPVVSYTSHVLQIDESFTEVNTIFEFDANNNIEADINVPAQLAVWINKGTQNNAIQADIAKQGTITAAGLRGQNIIVFGPLPAVEYMAIAQNTTTATADLSASFFSIEMVVRASDANTFAIFWQGNLLAADIPGSTFIDFSIDTAAGEFAFEFVEGAGVNTYTSIGAGIGSAVTFFVLKAEFKAGIVTMFINGVPLESSIDMNGTTGNNTVLTALPIILDRPFMIAGYTQDGVDIGSACDLRLMKVYKVEPSPEQKQRDTLEMLATI